jgi:hypothetical protein
MTTKGNPMVGIAKKEKKNNNKNNKQKLFLI